MTGRNAVQHILRTSCFTLLFSIPLMAFAQGRPVPTSPYVEGEMLVGMSENADTMPAARALSSFGNVLGYHSALHAFRVQIKGPVSTNWAVETARRQPGVAYVEPNYIRFATATPNDPLFASNQYGPKITQANLSWEIWQPSQHVTIAIVDTGIDYTHPDLADVILKDDKGNVVGRNIAIPTDTPMDDHGHGTHCAGIAAAKVNNGTGIAGMAGWNPTMAAAATFVKLMPVKVLNSKGEGTDANVADGITWAVDHGAKVISLSLGGPSSSNTLNNACKYAYSKGCLVVAAAGNSGVSDKFYPAACDNVISVGATDKTDTLASFSNYGSWVKVAAPGVDIASTYPGGKYANMSGTSMATPHVAGEVATLMAQLSVSNAIISQRIIAGVDPYKQYSGHTLAAGAGRINQLKALKGETGGSTTPPALLSIMAGPNPVRGGGDAVGMVTLTDKAPAGGIVVKLSSSDSAVTMPSTTTVPEGKTSVGFAIKTSGVAAAKSVTLTATLGSSSKATLIKVMPATISGVTLSATSAVGGQKVQGTASLDGPAGADTTVKLSSTNSAATTPATVVVPKGSSKVTFTITTTAVADTKTGAIKATVGTDSASASLQVMPLLSSITLSPSTVKSGSNTTATVTLTAALSDSATTINLASSDGNAAKPPATIVIPAGKKSGTVTISTKKLADGKQVTITASLGSASKKTTLTLLK